MLEHWPEIDIDIVSRAILTGYPRYVIPELETIGIHSNSEHGEREVRAGNNVRDENLLHSTDDSAYTAELKVCITSAIL